MAKLVGGQRDTVVVDMPLADGSRQEASGSEMARARRLLEDVLARVAGRPWQICLDLGDGAMLHVDCAGGVVKGVEGGGPEPDATLYLPCIDFLQLIREQLDPRVLMLYQRMKFSGSAAIAAKFLDGLSGRHIVSAMQRDGALPVPTSDLERAKADLAKYGYCLMRDALTPPQVEALRIRLNEQAAAEREIGHATRATGTGSGVPPIQPVWNLMNKGDEFVALLDHPLVDEFARSLLGDFFLLSSFTSKIAHPGCKAQVMHYDQAGVQPPLNVYVGLNIFFLLDDFTAANGGTRLVPGSHIPENGIAPDDIFSTEGSIAAEAPAGSALIFDTRLWHGTGANRSDRDRRAVFMLFCRSWMRTMENHTISVHDDVLAKLDKRKLTMLGFRTTTGHGAVEGPSEGEMVQRDFRNTVGLLRPTGRA